MYYSNSTFLCKDANHFIQTGANNTEINIVLIMIINILSILFINILMKSTLIQFFKID